jgi:hypothetical protein
VFVVSVRDLGDVHREDARGFVLAGNNSAFNCGNASVGMAADRNAPVEVLELAG